MTVHTAHPGHHRPHAKAVGIAAAGAVLAVGAGYGVATFLLEEAPASISEPADINPPVVNDDVEPGRFPGTDREERALMHRY